MKHDVFISHAQKDKSIADAIYEKLQSAGLKCCASARGMAVGEDWTEATRNAVGSCRVVVLVLTENANAAPHIKREIAHASYTRRIIVPFRLAETLPRREIIFYLSNLPWFNVPNPPAEEHLEALTARIKGLIAGSAEAGDAPPLQPLRSELKNTAPSGPANSWFGSLQASHYQTLGILKWIAITTFLCAVGLFLWFTFWQTKESPSLAESDHRSIDRDSSLSPTPLPQAAADASPSKQSSTFTRFGFWEPANGSATPVVQGSQGPSLNTPAVQSADGTSSPQPEVIAGEQAGGLASEPRSRRSPPVTHRVSHDHHQQYPGTQVREARRIADLENQRDSLRSQLKETEAKALAIQKDADLVIRQRDALQTRLNKSEEKAQITQRNVDLMALQLDELRGQLKEAEGRALTAQQNEELMRTQRDALQTRLQETESEAQAARKNADLATRERDALQSEMAEATERVQLAETNARLATSQRDAMEARLKKKEEEQAQEKRARLNRRGSDLAELPDNAPDTQFQEVRQDSQPVPGNVEFAQTQPPNPGQNAEPAPLTQALDSSIQPGGPSGK